MNEKPILKCTNTLNKKGLRSFALENSIISDISGLSCRARKRALRRARNLYDTLGTFSDTVPYQNMQKRYNANPAPSTKDISACDTQGGKQKQFSSGSWRETFVSGTLDSPYSGAYIVKKIVPFVPYIVEKPLCIKRTGKTLLARDIGKDNDIRTIETMRP